ncbi:MAG: uncharacterized protein A8A55_3408, partial [Amphiamblys sp. WSBS2006]
KLHEGNVMEAVALNINKKEHIPGILRAAENSILVGKVKRLELFNYSINILPKLKLHGGNVMEKFHLSAYEKKYLSEIDCVADNSIWLGKTKRLELFNYAIIILPKMKLHEGNVMEAVALNINKKEHIPRILAVADNSIRLVKAKRLELLNYSINILPKLTLHEEGDVEVLYLSADETEYLSGILRAADNSIRFVKAKRLELWNYSINILPKLTLREGNVMEKFHLSAYKTEHISEILCAADNSILVGKVKRLELFNYAINILPKLKLHE